MYFSIKGTVEYIGEGLVVLENNGIGYNIFVSDSTLSSAQTGSELKLYTYLQVREDAFSLFGFSSLQEKEIFLQLISVGGIGCKLAQTILSGISPCDLAVAVVRGDTKALCNVKGVGKKTAERIILELKEKVAKSADNLIPSAIAKKSTTLSDALTALTALGWSRQTATEILSSVQGAENMTLNEIISSALKNAGKNRI